MRHLSMALLVFLLVVLPSCKFFKDRGIFNKKQKNLVELLSRYDSIRAADSIRKVQEQIIAIEDARIDSLKKADEERLALGSKYNIIVGSFLTHEYATNLTEVYRQQGFDAKILRPAENKFELVAAEGHTSLGEAVSRLNSFQDTVLIEAWIYIKK